MKRNEVLWFAIFVTSIVLIAVMEAIALYLYYGLLSFDLPVTFKANEIGLILFGVIGKETFTGFWICYSGMTWWRIRKQNKAKSVTSNSQTGEACEED